MIHWIFFLFTSSCLLLCMVIWCCGHIPVPLNDLGGLGSLETEALALAEVSYILIVPAKIFNSNAKNSAMNNLLSDNVTSGDCTVFPWSHIEYLSILHCLWLFVNFKYDLKQHIDTNCSLYHPSDQFPMKLLGVHVSQK